MAKPISPPTTARLQLAQRMHQVLVREIGHAIDVERLVTDAHYARDVLLVCDALLGSEAPPLATQFRHLPPPADGTARTPGPAGAPGHAQQPNDWSRDTSGFGVTQPPSMDPAATGRARAAEPPDGHPERRRNWLPRWRDSR